MKHYRFSIDDNIRFFQDIAEKNYRSVFDNPFLGFLRSLHRGYGTKVHLNLFYEKEGFRLSQMPDRYRAEWEKASDWLKMSFHSLAEQPVDPYKHADAQTVRRDCELVHKEIIRFAGEKSLSPFTTIHYVHATREGCRALRQCGIKGLVGLFGVGSQVRRSYSLPMETCRYMKTHNFYKDEKTGLYYIRNDMILNNVDRRDIPELLSLKAQEDFLEIMIHEQYFYRDYPWYQPDFRDKVKRAVSWLTKHGYTSVFLEDILD